MRVAPDKAWHHHDRKIGTRPSISRFSTWRMYRLGLAAQLAGSWDMGAARRRMPLSGVRSTGPHVPNKARKSSTWSKYNVDTTGLNHTTTGWGRPARTCAAVLKGARDTWTGRRRETPKARLRGQGAGCTGTAAAAACRTAGGFPRSRPSRSRLGGQASRPDPSRPTSGSAPAEPWRTAGPGTP